MNEYMFLIRNIGDGKAVLSKEEHLAFVKQCEVYINEIKQAGKLIAAQPLLREGAVISKNKNNWETKIVNASKEIQVGYYHILADDINDAIEIAKRNPEFAFVQTASIEVRPVKMKEAVTEFIYPK